MLHSGERYNAVADENSDTIITDPNPIGLIMSFEFLEIRNLLKAIAGRNAFKGDLLDDAVS